MFPSPPKTLFRKRFNQETNGERYLQRGRETPERGNTMGGDSLPTATKEGPVRVRLQWHKAALPSSGATQPEIRAPGRGSREGWGCGPARTRRGRGGEEGGRKRRNTGGEEEEEEGRRWGRKRGGRGRGGRREEVGGKEEEGGGVGEEEGVWRKAK
ncbi:unnamed protein product [Arctogadus glacialis]